MTARRHTLTAGGEQTGIEISEGPIRFELSHEANREYHWDGNV